MVARTSVGLHTYSCILYIRTKSIAHIALPAALPELNFSTAVRCNISSSNSTTINIFTHCSLHINKKPFLKLSTLPCLSCMNSYVLTVLKTCIKMQFWKENIMNFTFSVFRKHTGLSGSSTSFNHVFEASASSSFNFFRFGKLTVAFDTFSDPHSSLPSYTNILLSDIILLKI